MQHQRHQNIFNANTIQWQEFTKSIVHPHIFSWKSEPCQWCGAFLLNTESKLWCCQGGQQVLPHLPALPPSLAHFFESSPVQAGQNS